MDAPILTMMVAVDIDSALRISDRLNRRLGYDRDSWTAFAARCLRSIPSGVGAED